MKLQSVLLCLVMLSTLLPSPLAAETDGLQEWIRLIELLQEHKENFEDTEIRYLRQVFRNPEALPEEVTEQLRAAQSIFDQLGRLASQKDWPRIDPITYNSEDISPFEIQEVFLLVHLVNLKARELHESGETDAAWLLIRDVKHSLRYLDENGTLVVTLVAQAGRTLCFLHELRLLSKLTEDGLEKAFIHQIDLLTQWVPPEQRTLGELHYIRNGIGEMFDQMAKGEELQRHRKEILGKWRQTESGRILAEQVEGENLLSFEHLRERIWDRRMRMREFELEGFKQVTPRPASEWEAFRASLFPSPDPGGRGDEAGADPEKEFLQALRELNPETVQLDSIRFIQARLEETLMRRLLDMILPYLSVVDISFRKDLAQQRILLGHLAAEEYFRQHGTRPDSLQALLEHEPRLAAEQIQDPFVGEPLRINKDGGRWRLYSVGENLKDHGGSIVPGERQQNDFFLYSEEGTYP